MTARSRRDDHDEVLFAERARLRPLGLRRSRARAEGLASFLGLDLAALRRRADSILTVVGSKGKGTATTYASATLAAAGMRVGTLTSPGFRSNRERIRVDGAAIGADAYAALVLRVVRAIDAAQGVLPRDGYLSPTGLFTLMGIRHFLDSGCTAWVLEAGMGGGSDEVSLFSPGVVALGPVFAEHIGVIGDSLDDIVREKLGVVQAQTATLVSVEQPHEETRRALAAMRARIRVITPETQRPPDREWPPGLSGANARLGVAAACALLDQRGLPRPDDARLASELDTVALPARLSVHRRGTQTWVLDAAVSGPAAGAALAWCDETFGPPASVLVCIPDGKDGAGVLHALAGRRVVPVRTDAAHLSFAAWTPPLPSLDETDLDGLGATVLALGTVHFAGDVLEALDVPTDRAFAVIPGRSS